MLQHSYKKDSQPGWGGETIFTEKMNVHIPLKLQLVCNKIANQVAGNEFSIFCRIQKVEGNNIFLEDYYTIPEQHVSAASIDYGKDPDEYVDTVIHRHPDGMNRFSGTDEAYINKNFKCSLLYTKSGGFVHGIYNMDIGEDVKLRLETIPIVVDGLGDIDIENIKYKTYVNPKYTSYDYTYGSSYRRVDDSEPTIREYNSEGKEVVSVSRGSQFEMSFEDEEDSEKDISN